MTYYEFVSNYFEKTPFFRVLNDEIQTGSNGLYGEKETPYRILSHWSKIIKDASLSYDFLAHFVGFFREYFEMHDVRIGPYKARYTSKKDTSNGLIGTAWNIEGMVSVI
ncbi:hypothetical protein, partial [Salinivibrio kushneri]